MMKHEFSDDSDSLGKKTKVFVINTPKSNEISPMSKLEATQREEMKQNKGPQTEQTQRNDSFLRGPETQREQIERLQSETQRRKKAEEYAIEYARIMGEANNLELIVRFTELAMNPPKPKSIHQPKFKSEKIDSELMNFKFPSKWSAKPEDIEVKQPKNEQIDMQDTFYGVMTIEEQAKELLQRQKLGGSNEEKYKSESPAESPISANSTSTSKDTPNATPNSQMILQYNIGMNSEQKTFTKPWMQIDAGNLVRDTTLFVSEAHTKENRQKMPGEMKEAETTILMDSNVPPESLVMSDDKICHVQKSKPRKSNSPTAQR